MATFSDWSLPGVWTALRLTYGVGFLISGADKFFNFITTWEKYLWPAVPAMLGVDATVIMYIVGAVEVILGALVLSGAARTAGYLVGTWLLAIATNLILHGSYLDIAIRDVVMAIGAFSFARLTAPDEFPVRHSSRRYQPHGI